MSRREELIDLIDEQNQILEACLKGYEEAKAVYDKAVVDLADQHRIQRELIDELKKETQAWVGNFITYDMCTKEFVAWDETQANEIGRFNTTVSATQAILEYAKTLGGEL